MEQKHAVVEVNLGDGGAGFIVGGQVGQLIVGTERLTGMACPHTAGDVVLAAHDVLPDGVDGLDVGGVAEQGCHIGHAGIHIAGTNGMSPCLCLFGDGLVALRVDVMDGGLAAVVEEELGLVEIAAVAGEHIESRQRHLGYLMSGHHAGLSGVGAHFLYHALSIALGDVEELVRPCGLVVCAGGVDHVPQIVELVAQHFLLHPTAVAGPMMGLLRVDGAGGIQIAVGLLGGSHHIKHAVDIVLQLLVGIGLQYIAGAFYRLVDIGVVERESHERAHVVGIAGMGGLDEILVASFTLALTEGKRDGHFAGGLDALPQKGVLIHLHGRERNLRVGIARSLCFGMLSKGQKSGAQNECFINLLHVLPMMSVRLKCNLIIGYKKKKKKRINVPT